MKSAIRIYALLLHLYPRRYRATFGAQMRQTFIDQYQDLQASQGHVGPRFWLALFSDEIQNIVREHMSWLTQENHFLKLSIAKVILAALFLIPLYPAFVLLFVRTSLALPHPSISGLGALIALAAVLLILPGVASILVSYLLASILAIPFASAKRVIHHFSAP